MVKILGEKRASALTREQCRLINDRLFEDINSGDPVQTKSAANTLSDYIRLNVREEAYSDVVFPPINITDTDLVPQVEDEKNVVICEKQIDSMGAVSVPYNDSPMSFELKGDRFKIALNRRRSQRYYKDVSLLRTWKMDLRQMMSDSSIKDIHTERDRAFQAAVDACHPTPDAVNPLTGGVHYRRFPGGMNRNSLVDMLKISRDTDLSIAPVTALTNHITYLDFLKPDRIEAGGDIAERAMFKGVKEFENYLELKWVVTIKKSLVRTNHIYLFPDLDFFGKSLMIEDITMHVEKKAYMVEFFSYDEGGATIANVGGMGHAYFPGN